MKLATCHLSLATFLAALLALAPLAAHADIGAIGSPVVPSNAPLDEDGQGQNASSPVPPKLQPAPQMPQGTAQQPPQVLLVLRFDQPRHFERELMEAIENEQKNKPDAFYQVISYLPDGAAGIDDAAANLALLTRQMQDLGVGSNHMQVETQYSGVVSYQEIRIFVY